MIQRKYTPRRASNRWLEGAPDCILDCFDHPQFADRFTIWFGKSEAFHVSRDGSIGQGPDQYHNTYITGLGTSENGGTSGSLEYKAHEVAAYRYRNKHRRVRWQDLPEATRRIALNLLEG
jgi:hypothetical protein